MASEYDIFYPLPLNLRRPPLFSIHSTSLEDGTAWRDLTNSQMVKQQYSGSLTTATDSGNWRDLISNTARQYHAMPLAPKDVAVSRDLNSRYIGQQSSERKTEPCGKKFEATIIEDVSTHVPIQTERKREREHEYQLNKSLQAALTQEKENARPNMPSQRRKPPLQRSNAIPKYEVSYSELLRRSSQAWRAVQIEREEMGSVDDKKMATLQMFL